MSWHVFCIIGNNAKLGGVKDRYDRDSYAQNVAMKNQYLELPAAVSLLILVAIYESRRPRLLRRRNSLRLARSATNQPSRLRHGLVETQND